MEKIDAKLKNIHKMLLLLQAALKRLHDTRPEYTEFIQDSVVARFKILIESTWKVMKLYLENEGLDISGAPKEVARAAFTAQLLNEQEYDKFISYLQLRNLASHLYDQPQYLLVVEAAEPAYNLIKTIINRIEKEK